MTYIATGYECTAHKPLIIFLLSRSAFRLSEQTMALGPVCLGALLRKI